jgi:rubredoxin/uncharacterized membrane protein
MKKWKCTVCGYIHEGPEPPETCPVCGADKSKFEEIVEDVKQEASPSVEQESREEEASTAGQDAPKRTYAQGSGFKAVAGRAFWKLFDLSSDLMVRFKAHPILVHSPNGVIPMSFAFCVLAVLFKSQGLATAALFSLIYVAFTMPLVLFSGYLDWKEKYGGNLTSLFMTKIACGGIIAVLTPALAIWLFKNPSVLEVEGGRAAFLITHLILLAAATVAGHMGGKLVFKE